MIRSTIFFLTFLLTAGEVLAVSPAEEFIRGSHAQLAVARSAKQLNLFRRWRIPNYSTPPTCDTAGKGLEYYDTDDNLVRVCNGTDWVQTPFGGGAAFPGLAADYTWTGIHEFEGSNSVDMAAGGVSPGNGAGFGSRIIFEGDVSDAKEGAINYLDSGGGSASFQFQPDIDGNGTWNVFHRPAAGSSGSLVSANATLVAMDGSDTVSIYSSVLTNANHTGAGNTLNYFNVPAITGDANSNLNAINVGNLTGTVGAAGEVEAAVNIGSGFDVGVVGVGGLTLGADGDAIVVLDNAPAAGLSGSVLQLSEALTAMDGSDTVYGSRLTLTNANHTGTGNTFNILGIDALTGDANSNLNAISIGALTPTGGAAGEVEAAISIDTGWDIDIRGVTSLEIGVGSSVLLNFNAVATDFTGITTNTLIFNDSLLGTMNGSDTTNILYVNPTNANHSGSGNTLHALRVGNITGDAEATENAIHVGTGWDFAFATSQTNPVFASSAGTSQWRFTANNDAAPSIAFNMAGGLAGEYWLLEGADLAVVGAAQNVDPTSNIVEIGAGAGASVTTVTFPAISGHTQLVTFVCKDANVTFNDSDAAGAANTLDLAGAATNFTCSSDDTITFAAIRVPGAGNARWMEVARSVN